MPDFQAKEKDDQHYPPQPEREPLDKVSDGTAVNHYYLRDRLATVEDVSAPGFFDFMRDTFRSGSSKGVIHMVTAHLGEVADGLIEVDLHCVEAPTPSGGPVVMAVADVKKFRPTVKPGGKAGSKAA